jgi:hypothetical protein
MTDARNTLKIYVGKVEEKVPLERRSVYVKIILKWSFQKYSINEWTGNI